MAVMTTTIGSIEVPIFARFQGREIEVGTLTLPITCEPSGKGLRVSIGKAHA